MQKKKGVVNKYGGWIVLHVNREKLENGRLGDGCRITFIL